MTMQSILIAVWALILWGVLGFFWYKKTLTEKALKFKEKMAKAREIEEDIIEQAKKKSHDIIERSEQRAQKLEEKRLEKMETIQNRLLDREEKMEEKLNKLEEEKQKILDKQQEAEKLVKAQTEKLSEVAKLSQEEATDQLFENIKQEKESEIKQFVEKFKTIKTEEADKEAAMVIAKTLPRIASGSVNEFAIKSVDLPNDDYKGKLIGREGRNISHFEKVTGVEMIIDDTPMVVRLSSFDAEKRFQAAETLERLLKDGRINPVYIEKTYNQVLADFDNILITKGKEALDRLNLPMMKPEVLKYIGQFYLRFSYGQNLWIHSVEVAKICEAIATEIGLDPIMAKKAGLFHDIGKVIAATGQSHTVLGGEALKKLGMHPIIINAAESHHYEVEMTHPISWVVAAADAISASRPGARFDTKDLMIEKMNELEKLIKEVKGVDKVHIMQAGREIMVYVNHKEVSDLELEGILKTIGEKIDDQLDYPGIIRITGIRENKIHQFLR